MPDTFFDPLNALLSMFPLWIVGLLLIAACLATRELGSYFYRRAVRRRGQVEADVEAPTKASDADNYVITSIFGLMAFLIALTFSMALDRYDARRMLVADEANAINTTYLRAGLFDQPHSGRLQAMLREYAHSRVAPDGMWRRQMEAGIVVSRNLRTKIWAEGREAVLPVRETELASYFVEALNNMFEVAVRREQAARAHIPVRILEVLLLYLLAAAGVLGYALGNSGKGHRQAATLLIVLLAVGIVVILDIDQPRAGTIKVPQTALQELVTALDQDAANAPTASSGSH